MIPVIIFDKCQCDPKKCTAKRMLKFGLGKEAKTLGAIPKGSVVLSPFSDRAMSPADIHSARKGLVVMDLTWTNIDEFPRLRNVEERALPYLLASNPINWGRPMELNSAEAVMAALYILGEKEQAAEFLGRFNWAPEFMRLNGEMLEDYSRARDSSDVVRIQNEYIEAVTRQRSVLRQPRIQPEVAERPVGIALRAAHDALEPHADLLQDPLRCHIVRMVRRLHAVGEQPQYGEVNHRLGGLGGVPVPPPSAPDAVSQLAGLRFVVYVEEADGSDDLPAERDRPAVEVGIVVVFPYVMPHGIVGVGEGVERGEAHESPHQRVLPEVLVRLLRIRQAEPAQVEPVSGYVHGPELSNLPHLRSRPGRARGL
jgi:pre-rRNA-processing protein TSR3